MKRGKNFNIDVENIRTASAVVAFITDGTTEILWGEEIMRQAVKPDGPESLKVCSIIGVDSAELPALAEQVRRIKSSQSN